MYALFETPGPSFLLLHIFAWVIVLGLGWCALVRGLVQVERTTKWCLSLLGLFVFGTALRFALANWGPGDFQVKQWEAFSPLMWGQVWDFLHGDAPRVLWRILFTVFPDLDTTIVVVAIFMSALTPVLLALCLRELGTVRIAAFSSGVILALQPLAVRFSGGQNRISLALFLATLALWALTRHRRAGRFRDLVLFVASTWLCCRTRPEAGVILLVVGLFLVTVRFDSLARIKERSFRRELVAMTVSGILGVLALYLSLLSGQSSTPEGNSGLESVLHLPRDVLWLNSEVSPIVLVVLAVVGVLAGVARRDRTTLWLTLSLLSVSLLVGFSEISVGTGHPHLANARYHMMTLPFFCAVVGLGVAAIADIGAAVWGARGRGAAVALVALAVLLSSVGPLLAVCAPRTVDQEYRFVRRSLMELPPSAVIYAPFAYENTAIGALNNPHVLTWMLGRGDWRTWPQESDADRPDGPAYFYRSVACSLDESFVRSRYPDSLTTFDWCEEGMNRAGHRPVLTADISAAPFGREVFEVPTIRIGFYQLTD